VPDIRYVCLSDLHFGAENSVLTKLAPHGVEPDPHQPGEVMVRLVDCLRALIERNESRQLPTLILCGDILELALATDNVAAMVFERFVELVFPDGGRLFDPVVYFVPGNHDHHMWEGARERQYSEYVRSRPLGEDLEIPWHTTRMFALGDPQPVEAELLTTLVHRQPHLADVVVQAVYPNLALSNADGSRCVVFHHGHYVEGIYRLMSTMKDLLFPGRPRPEEIWNWEAENFAWVDFFWSTLGRSGEVGTDVGLIYESFQSEVAMKRLAANLAGSIAARRRGPGALRWAEEKALNLILGRVIRRAGGLERSQPKGPLSASAQKGLGLYLEGPLRNQLLDECGGALPKDLSFVFGHTHKPYEAQVSMADYPAPVSLYNTGGWVVDGLRPSPRQGGSAILLDEDLNVASLRLYNQADQRSSYAVRLARTPGPGGNPLHDRLEPMIVPDQPPWRAMSDAAAEVVAQRCEDLAIILAKVEKGTG